MKLSAYKDLEASKRAQTLSRIILIAGAHLVVIGGAYVVSNFSGKPDDESVSLAGVGTWSNQSPDANQPSVDASANTLFDSRAGNLSGYNAGEGSGPMLASNDGPSSSSARYAPRRPSDSGASEPAPQVSSYQSAYSQDEVLQPVSSSSNEPLYPVRPQAPLSQTIEYKVQNGDSLWGISRRFSVTVAEITSANPGIKANAIRVGQVINIPRNSTSSSYSAPASEPATVRPKNTSVYTVKAGDSLSRIAARQGVTVAELRSVNGLSNDMIRIGQELLIPSARSSEELVAKQHRGQKVTIEAGDTLDKYAALYGVSVRELMELNDITNPRTIKIGQTLLIPDRARPQVTTTPSPSSQPTQRQPATRPSAASQTQPSMQTLDDLAPDTLPVLPTLDDDFEDEDLEEQPLIIIKE